MSSIRWTAALGLLALVPAYGQTPTEWEWASYAAGLSNTRYSPLAQIDAGNFNSLEIAWRLKTDNFGAQPEYNFESTPLMVGGVVYTTAGTRRAVVALAAGTGEILWMHRFDEGKRGEVAPRRLSGRGLAYRDDGGAGQIFYVTLGYRLIALDAATGRRIETFGSDGVVDLKQDLDQEVDPLNNEIGLHATPVVAGDTVIVGSAHQPGGALPSRRSVRGAVRGYDARSGARRWIFRTIPDADEFGNDTWLNESWRYTGHTGVWGQIGIDLELGVAYLPTETPTNDYYGGHRHGDNLFGNSLVAVDLETGERIWHYQFIHHDVWDWDIPCAPVLVDITVDGRAVKAVVQPTKQGWLYVFDRVTGEPVWPIEERPVGLSDVPGERLSPTQPFPTKPPAFDRQGIGIDDLIDFTPRLRAEAERLVSRYRIGPIFTPPSVADSNGTFGTLILPSAGGGANWPGGSVDPETGIFYQYSFTQVMSLGLVNDPELSDMDFIQGRPPGTSATQTALNIEGIPLIKPPWGRITAINLNAGEIVWQVPHGETADNIREHPLLEGVTVPRTGRPGRIGTLITKTLVIAGEPGTFTTSSGQRGAMLHAYDKATGSVVGSVYMPAQQTGSPMTYMHEAVQYIVVAIGGAGYPGELLAFRLAD